MDKTLPPNVSIVSLSEATGILPGLEPRVGNLDKAKRGDYIRLLLKFPNPPVTYRDKDDIERQVTTYTEIVDEKPVERPLPKNGHEFLTAMITQVFATGLIKCKVLANPSHAGVHGVHYGDDLTIQQAYVIEHTVSAPGEADRTAHLLAELRPIAPAPGRTYWTRNGATAKIWTAQQDANGSFLLGEVSWPSGLGQAGQSNVQWCPDGKHRQGDPGLDIVKDPSVSEVRKLDDQGRDLR